LNKTESERELLRALKPSLRVLDDEALNAEPSAEQLDSALTPIADFFVRNNGWLPEQFERDADEWTLRLDGLVETPRTWRLGELRSAFEVVTVTSVLECAGYGRADFNPPTDGLPWGRGPVGCARWTGVRLAHLLHATGVKSVAIYTAHHSSDRSVERDGPAISRGIPIEKALAPETLLAFAMNGQPLPFLHGGPLRLVVPGYPGSAWQKWLSRIELRDQEHDGEKMRGTDYRLPRMPIGPGEPIDEALFEVITDMPVNSIITSPVQGFMLSGPVEVRGFAWSGHVPLDSVAVSADGGTNWVTAELEDETERFAWRRFRATFRPAHGPVTLLARATDAEGRAQPLGNAPWNPRGYCNNGVHRVRGEIT
jgi:DMSO/TMAO reductase YedYZ molybdopterin-dependent catalytic subunit